MRDGVLGKSYTSGQRIFETAVLFFFAAFAILAAPRLLESFHRESVWLVAAAGLSGYLAADFVSGLVHWFGDTWGDPEWPIVGHTLIRGFREHHLDPQAITRHDFVEASGAIGTALLPVLVALQALSPARAAGRFGIVALFSFAFWVLATNEIHRWAHLARPPAPIAWLQRSRLILSPEHHAIHHRAPFDRHYCITAGWLNGVLGRLGFFPWIERQVTRATGALPRHADQAFAEPRKAGATSFANRRSVARS